MKALTGILMMLAFSATAYAEDLTQIKVKTMENKPAAQAAPATAEPATQATPAAAPAMGMVARSAVTSGIENREPVDQLTSATTNMDKVYYFTELRDMQGQTVTHRWEHNGEVMAEVPFEIGGPRWRVFSSKRLEPNWTGDWKVSVVDATGSTLSVNTFTYDQATAPSGMSSEMPKETPGAEQKAEAPNS